MPQETGYTQRVTPQAGAPAPLTSPADFGSDVGGAVEQAGDVGHEAALRTYQINRSLAADSQSTDFAAKFAALRPAIDANIQRLRTTDFNADSHVDDVQKYYQDATAPLTDGITDQRVLQNTQRQIAAYGGELGANEATYAAGQRAAQTVFDYDQSVSASNMRRATAPTVEAAIQTDNQETVLQGAARAGLQNVTPDALNKMALHESQSGAVAMFMRVNQLDPERSLEMLNGGQYDGRGLTVEQVDTIRNNAQTEINRNNALAKQDLAAQKSAYKDLFGKVKAQVAGGVVPDPADLTAVAQGSVKFNDLSDQEELKNINSTIQMNRQYQVYTPVQKAIELSRLLALPNPTADDQRAIYWYQHQGRDQNAEFNRDPVQWAADHASPALKPPPETAGLTARVAWMDQATPVFGSRPQPLSIDEAKVLQDEVHSGDQGKLDVADKIATGLPGADGLRAIRQVDPNDKMLEMLVRAAPADRPLMLAGAQVRAGDKALIDGMNGQTAQTMFQRHTASSQGNALELWDPTTRTAAFNGARNLYAQNARVNGAPATVGSDFNNYIDRALGGGITNWNGPVLMPKGYNEDQFHQTLQNYKPTTGPDAPWLQGPGGGRPMTGDELRQARPVARPDGSYEFHKPGGWVATTKSGKTVKLTFSPAGGP